MWKQHEQKARSSVCVLYWVCLPHGGTVSFVAVNNAALLPCYAKGLSVGQALR